MLVTYTEDGLRLSCSCSEFSGPLSIPFVQGSIVHTLVVQHLKVSYLSRGMKLLHLRTTKNTRKEVKNNYMKLRSSFY